MSETSKKGKDFELLVASMIRKKIDKSAQRNKGSHTNWNRRSDVYTELPIHLECKDHEILKPKEWFRQAQEAAMNKTPVVVFHSDENVMAMLQFDDLLNLFVEIADQKLEIQDLRTPIRQEAGSSIVTESRKTILEPKLTDGTLLRKISLCKNGHICTPGKTTCQTKGCQYSSTYIPPKAKKL